LKIRGGGRELKVSGFCKKGNEEGTQIARKKKRGASFKRLVRGKDRKGKFGRQRNNPLRKKKKKQYEATIRM